jgi:26S proteasome regulatory subunit N1
MLRNLSSYYYKDPSLLFCVSFYLARILENRTTYLGALNLTVISLQVRIAQGLVHMGKGLLTLNPYHSDRFLLSKFVLNLLNAELVN